MLPFFMKFYQNYLHEIIKVIRHLDYNLKLIHSSYLNSLSGERGAASPQDPSHPSSGARRGAATWHIQPQSRSQWSGGLQRPGSCLMRQTWAISASLQYHEQISGGGFRSYTLGQFISPLNTHTLIPSVSCAFLILLEDAGYSVDNFSFFPSMMPYWLTFLKKNDSIHLCTSSYHEFKF